MESRAFFSFISPFWFCAIIFIAALFRVIKTLIYPHQNNNDGGLVNVGIAAQHYTTNVISKIIFNNKRYFGERVRREDGGPGYEEIMPVGAIFIMLKYLYALSVLDYVSIVMLEGTQHGSRHKRMLKNAMRILNKHHA
ncbi:hypothetical protein K1719_010545 [Acacia pycnantha]|nr:hypothetical protein K1719_010545 [Acacia pycnantha]